MIGFGFAIAQSYEYVESEYLERTGSVLDAMHTPLVFGASFMILGLLGTVAGVLQYKKVLDRIKSDEFKYSELRRVPMIIAFLLLVIGILWLIAVLM